MKLMNSAMASHSLPNIDPDNNNTKDDRDNSASDDAYGTNHVYRSDTTSPPPTASLSSTSDSQPTQTSLFESLNAYPFASDSEFRNGLAVILGRPGTSATDEEVAYEDDLVLQAKCFYFSRKESISPPLDFSTYKSWLKPGVTSMGNTSYLDTATATASDAISSSSAPGVPVPLEREPVQSEPTYPSSFAHIVELITTGQPVPGIQQIPDTVLEGHETPSTVAGRRKPWEG